MKHYNGIDHARKLWVLKLIQDAQSIREAARRAKITPSAVSQALSSMESAVGRPLFVRKSGRLSPTPAGTALIRAAEPALRMLEQISELTVAQVPAIEWMQLGAYESLAMTLLPELLEALQDKLPSARITIQTGRSSSLAAAVRQGELCAAVIAETDDCGRLDVVELGSDRLGCFATPHAARGLADIDAVRASGLGFGVLSAGPHGRPRYFSRYLREVFGNDFSPTVLCDSFETLKSAARRGRIAAILPSRVALQEAGQLVEIPLPRRIRDRSLGTHAIWLASLKTCDPEEIRFLESELRRILDRDGTAGRLATRKP